MTDRITGTKEPVRMTKTAIQVARPVDKIGKGGSRLIAVGLLPSTVRSRNMYMASQRDTPKTFDPPTSGQVLGALVRAFELPVPEPSLRTARRYLRGEYLHKQRISDKRKQEIWIAIGEALQEAGQFPKLNLNGELDMPVGRLILLILAQFADKWDEVVGYVSGNSAPVDRKDLAAAAYLRLVVVDIALRATAVVKLSDLDEPGEDVPTWARENANRLILRQAMKASGADAPTRERLAELVGVADNTVDAWLDEGIRPSRENLKSLGSALVSDSSRSPTAISGWLDRQYSFAALADLLTDYIGREAVIDCARALNRFVTRTSRGLSEFSQLTGRTADTAQAIVLIGGVAGAGGVDLVRNLWRHEEDRLWRGVLKSAMDNWLDYFQQVHRVTGGFDEAAAVLKRQYGISREFTDDQIENVVKSALSDPELRESDVQCKQLVRITGDAAFKARNRSTLAEQARTRGDLEDAVEEWRRAVAHQPENANYHFQLAADLGKMRRVDEAIAECWITIELQREWDLPWAEVGVVLLNADRDAEAAEHMERAVPEVLDPTAHFWFILGTARMRIGWFKTAIEALEKALEERPEHGMALDRVADCYFELNEPKQGWQAAKKAHDLGFSETYERRMKMRRIRDSGE